MRKLSLLGGVALTLIAATGVLAATPSPAVVASTGHTWTTSFKDGTTSVSGRLTATATYSSGSLRVHFSGVTKGQKVAITLFDRVGSKTHIVVTRMVTIATTKGSATTMLALSKSELSALRALKSKSTRDLRVRTMSKTATGVFAGS